MKTKFNSIHHIAIISSNYDKARHFYVDILGLKVIRENNRSDKSDIKLDLQLNSNTEIELFIKSDAPIRTSNPEALGLRHLALQTDNIEEDIKYLIAQGVKVEPLRTDDFTSEKMVFFWDPDNLPIELHE